MKDDIDSLIKLFQLAQKHLGTYLIATFGVSARNLFIHLLNALLFSSIISAAQKGSGAELFNGIVAFVLLLMGFVILDTVFIFIQTNTLNKIENDIKGTLLSKILYAPMKEVNRIGQQSELVARINSDVGKARAVYGNAVIQPLICLISGVGAAVVIININGWLILWALFLGSLTLAFNTLLGRSIRRLSFEQQENQATLLKHFSELFKHCVNIRLMGLFGQLSQRFHQGVREYGSLNKTSASVNSLSAGFSAFETAAKYIGTILLGFIFF